MLSLGRPAYAVGNEVFLSGHFALAQVTDNYYWLWYRERLRLFMLSNKQDALMIDASIQGVPVIAVGEPFEIQYRISNRTEQDLQVTSLVLDIDESMVFVETSQEGDIRDMPGMAAGKYMWVRDDYIVQASSDMYIRIVLRPLHIGTSKISFAATALESYYYADDIMVDIVSN
jgi:hypothetical protein